MVVVRVLTIFISLLVFPNVDSAAAVHKNDVILFTTGILQFNNKTIEK